jgi:hypothetical protein
MKDKEWQELLNDFDSRLKSYRCEGQHKINGGDALCWEVASHYYDYNHNECYDTVCVCMSCEIAINEACRLLYRDNKGAFFEEGSLSINPFSKRAKLLASKKSERMEQLLMMQKQLTDIVQCTKCFEIKSNDIGNTFYAQDGDLKLLVKPYRQLITTIRPNDRRYYKDSDSEADDISSEADDISSEADDISSEADDISSEADDISSEADDQ